MRVAPSARALLGSGRGELFTASRLPLHISRISLIQEHKPGGGGKGGGGAGKGGAAAGKPRDDEDPDEAKEAEEDYVHSVEDSADEVTDAMTRDEANATKQIADKAEKASWFSRERMNKDVKERPYYSALVVGWLLLIAMFACQCAMLTTDFEKARKHLPLHEEGRDQHNDRHDHHDDDLVQAGAGWSITTYVRYKFGNWFAWRQSAYTVVVVQIFVAFVLFGSSMYCFFEGEKAPVSVYKVLIWLVAPDGGMYEKTGSGKFIGAFVSLGGLAIFAFVISFVHASFTSYLANVKAGCAPVVEGQHIVILGYSTETILLSQELCIAYRHKGGTTIVILSEEPKSDVERAIGEHIMDKMGSQIVVRSGSVMNVQLLQHVNAATASLVLVVPNGRDEEEQRDAFTFQVLIMLRQQEWPMRGRVLAAACLVQNIALMQELGPSALTVVPLNRYVAKLMTQCSRGWGIGMEVSKLTGFRGNMFCISKVADHLIGLKFHEVARFFPHSIVVGIARQKADDETGEVKRYMTDTYDDTSARTQAGAFLSNLTRSPAALLEEEEERRADTLHVTSGAAHDVSVHTGEDTVICDGDELVLVARHKRHRHAQSEATQDSQDHPPHPHETAAEEESDGEQGGVAKKSPTGLSVSSIASEGADRSPCSVQAFTGAEAGSFFTPKGHRTGRRQTVIFLGWNEWTGMMVLDLDAMVPPGSKVIIFAPQEAQPRDEKIQRVQRNYNHKLENLEVINVQGNLGSHWQLEDMMTKPLEEGRPPPLAGASRIFVLVGQEVAAEEADAFSLTTILHIHDILRRWNLQEVVRIVPQSVDRRSNAVFKGAGIRDYVSTSELMARVLAMWAVDVRVGRVLDSLLSHEDPHVDVIPLEEYCDEEAGGQADLPQTITFFRASEMVAEHGEVLIGWTELHGVEGRVVLNPHYKHVPRQWRSVDRLMVLRSRTSPMLKRGGTQVLSAAYHRISGLGSQSIYERADSAPLPRKKSALERALAPRRQSRMFTAPGRMSHMTSDSDSSPARSSDGDDQDES